MIKRSPEILKQIHSEIDLPGDLSIVLVQLFGFLEVALWS